MTINHPSLVYEGEETEVVKLDNDEREREGGREGGRERESELIQNDLRVVN